MFEASDRPPVSSKMRCRRKGVTALAAMPLVSASARAASIWGMISARGISALAGIGLATSWPPGKAKADTHLVGGGDVAGTVHAQR